MYCSDKAGCGYRAKDGRCFNAGNCKHEISYAEHNKLSKEEIKAIDELDEIPFK